MKIQHTFKLSKSSFFIISSIVSTMFFITGCDATVGNGSGQVSDPVIVEFPIAYIERPLPRDEEGQLKATNILTPGDFNPGARLIIKERASVTALEIDVTDGVFDIPEGEIEALYDVKDLAVSSTGDRLLFSMRAPEDPNADDDNQPTWNIWEYNLDDAALTRIIADDSLAETGDDIDPYYLPDDRIVFSSNRRSESRRILLDEGKPQFAPLIEAGDIRGEEQTVFNLHVIEDGQDITQITFNESHDLQPTVLNSGEIIFVRQDNYIGGPAPRLSTYRIKPDGSELSVYYGYHREDIIEDLPPVIILEGEEDTRITANDRVALRRPVVLTDGSILFSQKLAESFTYGGDIVTADVQNFTDNTQPTNDNLGATGPAQTALSFDVVNIDGSGSFGGYYNSAFPLYDGTNRLIISWSSCLLDGLNIGTYINQAGQLINERGQFVDREGENLSSGVAPVVLTEEDIRPLPCTELALDVPDIALSEPAYGLWLYDVDNQTQTPVVLAQADTLYTDAVVFESKAAPIDILAPIPSDEEQVLIDEKVGIVNIRSVYDLDGVDTTPLGIEVMADPSQTNADDRPARFLRIIKAVSQPSEDVRDIDNSAFGEGPRQMKDIIGYVPIEPDGSAMFKVPASIAFTFSVLDAQGRRVNRNALDNNDIDLGRRHGNWSSVAPGETKTCTGCHNATSTLPHGRDEAQAPSVNFGASSTGFANSALRDDAGMVITTPTTMGQTMAEYYAEVNGARTPSTDIVFEEEWALEGAQSGTDIQLRYSSLATPSPARAGCLPSWSSACRSVINYETHIQPLWELERLVENPADPANPIIRTCTSCHNEDNFVASANGDSLETQLELTAQPPEVSPGYIRSFAQLFESTLILEANENGIIGPRTAERLALDENGGIVYELDGEDFVLDDNGDRIPLSTPDSPCTINDNNGFVFLVRNETTGEIEYQTTAGMFRRDEQGFRIPVTGQLQCTIGRRLNTNGARNNTAFFDFFSPGSGVATPHWIERSPTDISIDLSPSELKLISEWLDIGAQYYNDPFDAPEDD